MLDTVQIKTNRSLPLRDFLEGQDFVVEQVTDTVCQVNRVGELPVYVQSEGSSLYFEKDLGALSGLGSESLYRQLLDLNTEILPVSVGIDSSNPEDPRLVLVESRESKNLDENEILSVFNALEIAADKVEAVLADHV